MLHNDITIKEKNIKRKEILKKDNALNYVFYSIRNIFVFLFEREIETFLEKKGFVVDVFLKADSRYQSVNFIFHDKKKTVERKTLLEKESAWYVPLHDDISCIFYKTGHLGFGDCYRHQKPHFDIQMDELLNSDEFKTFFKDIVSSYLNYPFNDSMKYEDKIEGLKKKKVRAELIVDLIKIVNPVLPLYYKSMIEKEVSNKKYNMEDFIINDNNFLLSMRTSKDDVFQINISFNKEKDTVNAIETNVFIPKNVDIVFISRGEGNKKSIKAITKEINDFYLNENIVSILMDSLNNINFPYTYTSKLSF